MLDGGMDYLSSLNKEQRRAAEKITGPLLLLAGAGTGKTRVITYRMLHMLNQGLSPQQIVGMTFTNKAAKEMKERLKALGGPIVRPLFIGTFHSFCIKILREYAEEAGLTKQFQLIGTGDQIDMVSRALEDRNLQGVYRAAEIHARISFCKNNLITPEDVLTNGHEKFTDNEHEIIGTVYALYEKHLSLSQAIDFDDCIFKCVHLLRANPQVRDELHKRYTHYLVDEFQDTNFAQLTLLRELVNSDNHICVVGDDDQSIYSWRGAMYETIEKFEELFQGSELIKLEQNYRCTSLILDAANQVIKNNVFRKDKTLWSENKSNHPIVIKPTRDETEEAQWVALKILGLLGRGYKASDIGILYRANALARPIEIALREHRLPYKIFGGQSFFEKKEVKDFMAYLRLMVNRNDRLSFWRVINTPNRNLGIKSCEIINEHATKLNISPLKALGEMIDQLPKKSVAPAMHFMEMIQKGAELPIRDPEDFENLCTFILQETKLDHFYREKSENVSAGLRKAEMIRELPKWLRRSAEKLQEEQDHLDMRELIDAITLSPSEREREEDKSQSISLMTIHSAKGLEFPHVFICGTEDDLLPHRNSVEEAHGLSEERRLFYVALTRAKEQLYLSHTLTRSGIQRAGATKKPSRFIQEIPEHLLVTDENFAREVAERQQDQREKTTSRLSMLKDELRRK